MTDALYRWAYVMCVYTGFRAVFNRIRSRLDRDETAVASLHGSTIRPQGLGSVRVFVHAGPRPRAAPVEPAYGMIGLRLDAPRSGPFLYRYLCLTSHFGCGQVEVAFYEREGRLTIYAVRDVARSNAARLGWRAISRRLGSSEQDAVVVRALVSLLEDYGLSVRLAPARECVALALDRRLVHPRTYARTRAALERKYRRLPRALVG